MALAVFDKATELRSGTAVAITATASETGVAIPIRFMQPISWVIDVTAIDATTADETYVFTLQVSDLVGGTYTTIATVTWPRTKTGALYVPVSGQLAVFQDADCAFVRVTATLGGTTPILTYGSYLTKAAMGNMGIATGPGNILAWV